MQLRNLLGLGLLGCLLGSCAPRHSMGLHNLAPLHHQTLVYRVTCAFGYTLSFPNQRTQNDEAVMTYELAFKLRATAPAGCPVWDLKIQRYTFTRLRPEIALEIPANPTDSNDLRQLLHRSLIGLPLVNFFDPATQMWQIRGADSLWNQMRPTFTGDSTRLKLFDEVVTSLSDQTLTNNIGQLWRFIPTKKARKNQPWISKARIQTLGGPSTNTIVYHLVERTPEQIILAETLTENTPDHQPLESDIEGVHLKYFWQGIGHGTTRLDARTGWLLAAESSSKIDGRIEMKAQSLPNVVTVPSQGYLEFHAYLLQGPDK